MNEQSSARVPAVTRPPIRKPHGPAVSKTPARHVINGAGDCNCGQDGCTCQRCGKRVCGTQAEWIKDMGNLCRDCLPAFRAEESEQRPDPTATSATTPVPTLKTPPAKPTAASAAAPSPGGSGLLGKMLGREQSKDNSPHLIIEARAGTGKTTTLVEALKRLMETPTPGFIPSPQQQAVFDAVALSQGKAESICFVAFNNSIAKELKTRVPKGVDAMTMHSMGLKAVTAAFPHLRQFNLDDAEDVVPNIVASLMQDSIWNIRRDPTRRTILSAVTELVSKCKMNLTDLIGVDYDLQGWQRRQILNLAQEYEIELPPAIIDAVVALVPLVLDRCKDPKVGFNFDDMIWLPVVLDLPVKQYDLLMVDEAQDLNRCQQALAKRAGKRLILCGDPKQAIYGFAGADAESMSRMERELSTQTVPYQGRGCITLPLTVTRRCGKAIVKEANRLVPDFEAHESNLEGSIKQAAMTARGTTPGYQSMVQPGDMVLCRINSVLIRQCLSFLKQNRRAFIQGRKDVGKGLIAFVEARKAETVAELINEVTGWYYNEAAKEQAKVSPREAVIEAAADKRDCILALCSDLQATDPPSAVTRKLKDLFSDSKDADAIRLSSIHKAKGLEAQRVFILAMPSRKEDMPPAFVMTWLKDAEQEYNLLYVAITRAIEELVWVS